MSIFDLAYAWAMSLYAVDSARGDYARQEADNASCQREAAVRFAIGQALRKGGRRA